MNDEQRTKNNKQVYLWMFTWLTWACTRSTPSLIEVISVWYNVVIICKLQYYQRALSMIPYLTLFKKLQDVYLKSYLNKILKTNKFWSFTCL